MRSANFVLFVAVAVLSVDSVAAEVESVEWDGQMPENAAMPRDGSSNAGAICRTTGAIQDSQTPFLGRVQLSKETGETVCMGVAYSGGKDITDDEMEQKRKHLKGMFRPRRSKDPRPTKVALAVRELTEKAQDGDRRALQKIKKIIPENLSAIMDPMFELLIIHPSDNGSAANWGSERKRLSASDNPTVHPPESVEV